MGGQLVFLKVTATLNKRAKHSTERMCVRTLHKLARATRNTELHRPAKGTL